MKDIFEFIDGGTRVVHHITGETYIHLPGGRMVLKLEKSAHCTGPFAPYHDQIKALRIRSANMRWYLRNKETRKNKGRWNGHGKRPWLVKS